MILGLISDTHGLLRPEVFGAFEGVDRIIHAGDIGDARILDELEAIAPVTAVWGNTGGHELRQKLPEKADIVLEGFSIRVLHGQQFGSPTAAVVGAANPDVGMVVFGHSHVPEKETVGGVLAVNPGSAGPARFKLPISVATAEIGGEGVTISLMTLVQR